VELGIGAMEMVGALTWMLDAGRWRDRRVLLTGHTGFKGGWMALLLEFLGARVIGLSLEPDSQPNLYGALAPWPNLTSQLCDIRDLEALSRAVAQARPEIVIHMAAQSLVRKSYRDPLETIRINVLGAVHLLEALRHVENLTCVLVVTSDKVYENRETGVAFRESASLGGHDPYSASKAAAEILTSSYARSFYRGVGIPVCTARAGNVIGGGDWAEDRLVPDLWRAFQSGQRVAIRNPDAVRPWQHVLDPLYGYLLYIQHCLAAPGAAPFALNFGPPSEPRRTVLQVTRRFAEALGSDELWTLAPSAGDLPESLHLSIDSSAAFAKLGWATRLDVDEAIEWTCDWYRAFQAGEPMRAVTEKQIEAFAQTVGHDTTALQPLWGAS
jgi:CDP-glucose 4,6-dehydratase